MKQEAETSNATADRSAQRSTQLCPADRALANLEAALCGECFVDAVANNLSLAPDSVTLIPHYVRYKPGENCLIGFKCESKDTPKSESYLSDFMGSFVYAKLFSLNDYPLALEKAESRRWLTGFTKKPFVAAPENRAILYFFPNDAELKGVRLISEPKKIQRSLYDFSEIFPAEQFRISDRKLRAEIVRYKPERRAVIRFTSKITNRKSEEKKELALYLRFYADSRAQRMYDLMRSLESTFVEHDGVTVPETIGVLDDRQALIVREAPGKTVEDILCESNALIAVRMAASALAKLHSLNTPEIDIPLMADPQEEMQDIACSISYWSQQLGLRSLELAQQLKAESPDVESASHGLAHGDYHPGQALIENATVTLIDFDRAQVGDQRRDIGEFCAQLHFLELNGYRITMSAEALCESFIEKYETSLGLKLDIQAVRFWTVQRLLALAEAPIRRAQLSTSSDVEKILDRCQLLLK